MYIHRKNNVHIPYEKQHYTTTTTTKIHYITIPIHITIQTHSGAVWKLRWPSWAFHPNEPYGSHAHASVSACPQYVSRHPRTLSNATAAVCSLTSGQTVSVTTRNYNWPCICNGAANTNKNKRREKNTKNGGKKKKKKKMQAALQPMWPWL